MHINEHELLLRTGEIVACLTKCKNTRELVEEIHNIISKIIYAENFCVVLLGDDGYLRFPYVVDTYSDENQESLEGLTIDDIHSNLIFYALTSNLVCNYSREMIETLQQESLVILDSRLPEQWVSIPLSVDDKSLGAVILQSYDPQHQYNDNDIELMVIISHVLSNALSVFSFQEQLHYANQSLTAYQGKLESLIEARTASLEKKKNMLQLEVTQRKLLQKELEQKVLQLETESMKNRELQERLEHQAAHDFLTGLANRQQLQEYLVRCRSKIERGNYAVYLLFIDLDGFKAVNDTYGHEMGDKILISVSQRLTQLMRGHDLIARIGGDEFVVVLEQIDHPSQVEDIAMRVIAELSREYEFDDQTVSIGCSIGVANAQSTDGLDKVILNADQAMYVAKAKGKGTLSWHKE